MAETKGKQHVPEDLFHTTLTVVDKHRETYGPTEDVQVLGTHTSLTDANTFALTALESLGYKPGDFVTYATCTDTPVENWAHGDDVIVYAKAPNGREFIVRVDKKPNTQSLPAGFSGEDDDLHYVLQSKTDYRQERRGSFQQTDIRGCYPGREHAMAAARAALLKDRDEYAQYDVRDDVDSESDWPFGEDVVVRAVAQTGENFSVAVKSAPEAYKKHRKSE